MKLPPIKCDHKNNKHPDCPICQSRKIRFNMKKKSLKESFSGSAPTPFIGSYNYPNVNVGIMSPQFLSENNWKYDAPRYWAKKGFSVNSIMGLRSELVNARKKANVKSGDRLKELSKEIGMAKRPVDVEIDLTKRPVFTSNVNNMMAPTGPKAEIKKAKATSNPKIDRKVDKVVDDTDLKAEDAMSYLYKNEFDEAFLSKVFSVGQLGVKSQRKMVPTKWSITAVDQNLCSQLKEKIKDNNHSDHKAFFGDHLGNYYIIMLFPDSWGYELFEVHTRRPDVIASDSEGVFGRKDYVQETAGAYFTAQLAALEYLEKAKRKAKILAIRLITDEYTSPLGVWVTREAARNAMKNTPVTFADQDLMLKYAKAIAKKKFGISIDHIIQKSRLLKENKEQTKLNSF
ncbi:MAG: hypothetical protein ACQEP1_05125 [Nanobdellota archaeon]